jgi:hypothetical protein
MQEPTHILAGVIIQKSAQSAIGRRWFAMVVMAVAAFLSHGLLDRLANMTYHPPRADFHDPFWLAFHSCVLLATILFLYIWWRRYAWCIAFAMLPDLDWVFIHGGATFYRKPYLHNFLHIIFDDTPPFSKLRVPNNRHNPWACLWEVGLVLAMLLVIRYAPWRDDKHKPSPTSGVAQEGPKLFGMPMPEANQPGKDA